MTARSKVQATTDSNRGLSIVVPTWNGRDLLERFLPSVLACAQCYTDGSNAPAEIIVVDDGSSDDTARWLSEQGFSSPHDPQVDGRPAEPRHNYAETAGAQPTTDLIVVRNEVNAGFGASCNLGFGTAKYPLVFLLNNDVEPAPDSARLLAENFASADVFGVHCRVVDLRNGIVCGAGQIGGFSRGFIRVHRSYEPAHEDLARTATRGERFYSMFAGGGSSMFDRKKFVELGGFDPLLSPYYWEDVELSYRAWKRGYVVLYDSRALVRHRVSSTIGRLSRRRVRRIEQRNRLICHWIHLHDRKLAISNVLWVLVLAVTAPLRLRPGFLLSLTDALRMIPRIRERRRAEKRASKTADVELLRVFEALEKRPDIVVRD